MNNYNLIFVSVIYIKEEQQDNDFCVQADPLLLPSDIRVARAVASSSVKSENQDVADLDIKEEPLLDYSVSKCYTMILKYLLIWLCYRRMRPLIGLLFTVQH